MSDRIELDQIKAFFQADRFAMEMGIEIESVSAGEAVCSFTTGPEHMNAGNTVQGGAIFTLADFAFAVAANAGQPLTVSLSNQITYLKPCRGSRLTARAVKISSGKSTCFYRVAVTDELKNLVAEMTVNGYIKR